MRPIAFTLLGIATFSGLVLALAALHCAAQTATPAPAAAASAPAAAAAPAAPAAVTDWAALRQIVRHLRAPG